MIQKYQAWQYGLLSWITVQMRTESCNWFLFEFLNRRSWSREARWIEKVRSPTLCSYIAVWIQKHFLDGTPGVYWVCLKLESSSILAFGIPGCYDSSSMLSFCVQITVLYHFSLHLIPTYFCSLFFFLLLSKPVFSVSVAFDCWVQYCRYILGCQICEIFKQLQSNVDKNFLSNLSVVNELWILVLLYLLRQLSPLLIGCFVKSFASVNKVRWICFSWR